MLSEQLEGRLRAVDSGKEVIGVVGLGYVGIPVAVAFARRFPVIAYDINPERVAQLARGIDPTNSVSNQALQTVQHRIQWTTNPEALRQCSVILVTVPTPVTSERLPDLRALFQATQTIGEHLQKEKQPVIIYESTVYPGCTRDVLIPRLEEVSHLKACMDFHVGYSPERLNPGDSTHRFETITKVVSACDANTRTFLRRLYSQVIEAPIHEAPSIEVAEAAKVLENTQRDINIALINEMAMICYRLGINIYDVLDAAATKWNFHRYVPGLVGGHCVSVDPYYLAYRAYELGYTPSLILAGRRVNEDMPYFCVWRIGRTLMQYWGCSLQHARILICGITFKENINDTRNSLTFTMIRALHEMGALTDALDPWVDRPPSKLPIHHWYTFDEVPRHAYDAVVITVAHKQFRQWGIDFFAQRIQREGGLLLDMKGIFRSEAHTLDSMLRYETL